MDSKSNCFVRLCKKPSDGKSPISVQPLCAHHLQADVLKCEKAEAIVADRIAYFRKYQGPLRLMQQRLASDLQLLDCTFKELKDTISECQGELIEAITKHNVHVMDSLAILGEMDDLETELKSAKSESNLRGAFLVTENLEKSLESLNLDSELLCMNEEKTEVRMAAFPDVKSAVQSLQMSFEMSLRLAGNIIERIDIRRIKCEAQAASNLVATENAVQLTGTPSCLTICNNTTGFAFDESGVIVKVPAAADGSQQTQLAAEDSELYQMAAEESTAGDIQLSEPVGEQHELPEQSAKDHQLAETAAKRTELPQPSVLIAVECAAASQERNIVVASFDSHVVGSVPRSFDQPIRDLHCDNDRQSLFIVHDQAITVTDLCGVEQSKIEVSDLQDDVNKLCCITGDRDKLFILAERADGKPVIFGLSKKSNEVQLKLSVAGIDKVGVRPRISVRDRMLFVNDGAKLHTVCSITGMLLSSNELKDKGKFDLSLDFVKEDRKYAAFIAQQVSSTCGTPYFGASVKAPIDEHWAIQFTDDRRCVAFEVSGNTLYQSVFEI